MGTHKPGPSRHEKLKWHPAFLQALQLELVEYKNFLQFKYEYQLTAESLRVDLLVIRKPPDLTPTRILPGYSGPTTLWSSKATPTTFP
ncbi:MAG: hypothetical protein LBU16_03080 [Treponema sp.]|jgi:hypothetical protein|nr:hypothetical protein [Treponema sp.]